MPEPFNPYRQWLGLNEIHVAPNHYRLLGIDELETDLQRIARIADARMAGLRKVRPGEHAREWQRILDEMAVAKLCLTNPVRKAQYDELVREEIARRRAKPTVKTDGDYMPPPSAKREGRDSAPAIALKQQRVKPAAKPMLKTAISPSTTEQKQSSIRTSPAMGTKSASPFEDDVETLLDQNTTISRSSLDKRSDPSLRPAVALGSIALVLMLAAIAWASRERLGRLGLFAGDEPAETRAERLAAPTASSGESAQPDKPGDVTKAADANANSLPEGTTLALAEAGGAVTKGAPADNSTNEPNNPSEADGAQQSAELTKLLREVHLALSRRNVSAARESLQKAVTAASTDKQKADVARWQMAVNYVGGFWQAVGKGLSSLQPTDELDVGATTTAVVEVDSKTITLHIEGKNKTYTIANMPAKLAIALANRWFDAALPANKLYLGTFHAVDPSGDAAEAKRLWDEATRGGASAEQLYPLLALKPRPVKGNNTPEQQAGIAAVPDSKRVLKARKAVRVKFQKEIAAADSPDAKVELAAKLAEAGVTSQDPVERYTLLREACEFSAGRGDLIDIEVTVNQLADHFKVDKLTVELEALKKASDSPDRNVAKTAAESGMQLASRITDAKRADLAKRLGAMVVVAARKSGDKLLVEQAQQTKKQLDQVKPVKPTR